MEPCPPEQAREVRIGHQAWRVEVAHSPAQRQRGLSGRKQLPPETAMWFVLPGPGHHGFWMKDMAFAIDLAWVTPQGRVAGVETLAPCRQEPCRVHYPPEPVGFVLEAGAGAIRASAGGQARWLCEPE